jgi:UDP-N-acetylmuramate--alanine ligase
MTESINITEVKRVYLIGIGGIGMSALARYFHGRGAEVSGYDRRPSPLTRQLVAEGIGVHYGEGHAPRQPDLVIYTPAIPADQPELVYFREQGIPLRKRSEVLGLITRHMYGITVAGTHGKTTVSTLIAHILRDSGYGCTAFLGGISVNYQTNFWPAKAPAAVIEADEYDRSFLRLHPRLAVLTAMDPDHLDIYGTAEAMEEAYLQYTHLLSPGDALVHKYGLPRTSEMGGLKISYSLENHAADSRAEAIRPRQGGYCFRIVGPDWTLDNAELSIGGLHNVENTVAAATVAKHLGIEDGHILRAIRSFRGIKRRFEYIINTGTQVFIDDYAHHPEELRALLSSARSLFPAMPCTVLFQPHLYSRTRDLADGFADALDLADQVILLPIYPARETPLPGVDSRMIIDKMKNPAVELLDKAQAMAWLAQHRPAFLITAGAGDIDEMVPRIRTLLLSNPSHPHEKP